MNDRKEPTISAYSPTKEDGRRAPAAGRPSPPPTSSRGSSAARPMVVKSKAAPFALFIAFIAIAGAGFLYWQLLETQKVLHEADLRIADLESKFELSDDESTASVQTIQAKLKETDSEIRKLWGVAYDTNRKAIESNKNGLAQIKKTVDTTKNSIKTETKALTAELNLVSDLVEAQQSSLSAIEANNQTLVNGYQSVNDNLNRLETQRKELDRRIKTNEQAIEAIDAFRRNVNQQLLQLRSGT